ncbi:uncharacterized protein LOC142362011 [Opisthocomus hoazin]|uniref:uncharacterized protein LOC142362011 n=1 Tax=Opisthocomus hoazin TaxID=30419 RepID=UPI003F52ECD0
MKARSPPRGVLSPFAQKFPNCLCWQSPKPQNQFQLGFWFRLLLATKAPRGRLPPAGLRRRMERKRQKLVGRDKGSLTEQQTEGTVTTTIQIRRKIRHKLAQRTVSPEQDRRHALLSRERVPAAPHTHPPPPTGTQRDGTCYNMPGPLMMVLVCLRGDLGERGSPPGKSQGHPEESCPQQNPQSDGEGPAWVTKLMCGNKLHNSR